MKDKDLRYWYENTSMLGYAEIIRRRLPWYLRPFVKVYVDEKYLDSSHEVIRVYYSYCSYSDARYGRGFCYEFKLDDMEEIAQESETIAKATVLSYYKDKSYKNNTSSYKD